METVQLAALIKSTIMALQHANQTGNYSVLRDLGTPVFRERFDQAQLTAIFSNLRSRGINLTPVLFLAPNLTKQPEMTEGNELHLVGNFPTQPLQIQFEMLFLQIDGVWRINGFSADAVPQQASAMSPPPAGKRAPNILKLTTVWHSASRARSARKASCQRTNSEKKIQKTTSQ